MLTPSALLHVLLLPAFLLVLVTWILVSLVLLLRGLSSGRRALALARAREDVRSIQGRELDESSERSRLVTLIATVPDSALLTLGASPPGNAREAQLVAEIVVARLGRSTVEGIALTPANPRHNWRRIAAMQLLARAQTPGLAELLTRSVSDRDQEIVGASLALLGRLPERAAADALLEALKEGKYTRSRIATYLDLFPLPLSSDLRPLLHHPEPDVRYWAATLLGRHRVDGIEADLAALTRDPVPLVRKAALMSLADLESPAVIDAARPLLDDRVWYVRAHAARAIASYGDAAVAEEIAPLLTDREWWVRLAAKESLAQLGDEVWSVLVPYLDHDDQFARNGAAEVLQNIGILDSLIVLEAVTARPSPAKLEMLRKIAAAGGTRMTAALLERVDVRTRPRVRALLETLGLEPAGVES